MLAADWSLYRSPRARRSAICSARSRLASSSPSSPATAICATSAQAISAPPTCCAPATRRSPPLTLLLDLLKGTAAVLIGARFGPDAAILAGLGAFLGHLFPVWLGFRGGKGVATYIGVLLGLYWPGAIAFCAIWLLVALRHPLLIASGARGECHNPSDPRPCRQDTDRSVVPLFHRAALLAPRRQYRTPAARRGGAHWREKDLIRAATCSLPAQASS